MQDQSTFICKLHPYKLQKSEDKLICIDEKCTRPIKICCPHCVLHGGQHQFHKTREFKNISNDQKNLLKSDFLGDSLSSSPVFSCTSASNTEKKNFYTEKLEQAIEMQWAQARGYLASCDSMIGMMIKCKENIENYIGELKYTLKSFDSDIKKIGKCTEQALPNFRLDVKNKMMNADEIIEEDMESNMNSIQNSNEESSQDRKKIKMCMRDSPSMEDVSPQMQCYEEAMSNCKEMTKLLNEQNGNIEGVRDEFQPQIVKIIQAHQMKIKKMLEQNEIQVHMVKMKQDKIIDKICSQQQQKNYLIQQQNSSMQNSPLFAYMSNTPQSLSFQASPNIGFIQSPLMSPQFRLNGNCGGLMFLNSNITNNNNFNLNNGSKKREGTRSFSSDKLGGKSQMNALKSIFQKLAEKKAKEFDEKIEEGCEDQQIASIQAETPKEEQKQTKENPKTSEEYQQSEIGQIQSALRRIQDECRKGHTQEENCEEKDSTKSTYSWSGLSQQEGNTASKVTKKISKQNQNKKITPIVLIRQDE